MTGPTELVRISQESARVSRSHSDSSQSQLESFRVSWRQIAENLIFGQNLGLRPKFELNFFTPQNHQYLLDIIPVYDNIQNQENLMVLTRENGQDHSKKEFGDKNK